MTTDAKTNRRDFICKAVGFGAFAAVSGCRIADCTAASGRPRATRGVIVSAKNLSGKFDWPRLAHDAGLTTIATHIGPADVIPFMKSDLGHRFTCECAELGLAVEHELHAIEYLLPRDMFAREPELFRMDKDGNRTPDSNCCPSNPRALDIIAGNAVEVAKVCRSTTGRYYYWMTDGKPLCQCPKCRGLSGADQAVLVENAMVGALRAETDSGATLSHLAYLKTLETPRNVRPDPSLFLEFAPIGRWTGTPCRDPLEEGGTYLTRLDELLTVFPAATAQVCEYWLDASLFCKWKKPLVRIPWNAALTEAEIAAYAKRGIANFTTFAVSVDDDYVNDFGADSLGCVKEYGELLRKGVKR